MCAEKVAAVGGNSTPCGLNGLSGVGGPPPKVKHDNIHRSQGSFHVPCWEKEQEDSFHILSLAKKVVLVKFQLPPYLYICTTTIALLRRISSNPNFKSLREHWVSRKLHVALTRNNVPSWCYSSCALKISRNTELRTRW